MRSMRRPRISEALLRGFIADPDLEEAILGDLAEEWSERAERAGPGPADAWHRGQALKSVPHLLRAWWRQQSPGQAVRALGRVALVLFLAISLAAVTFVGMSTAGGGPTGQPVGVDPHVLAIDMLLAAAVWATAGGLILAWRTSRAPMCPVALLGLSWIPATLVPSALFPPPGPPAWFLAVFPTLLFALTVIGGTVATALRGARHRKDVPLAQPDPSTPEEAMKTARTAYRLAARPLLAAALVLAVPLAAMQFTDEVVWTLLDFAVMGALVVGTGVLFELARMKSDDTLYRLAAGVGLAAGFLLVWANLAVGVIGSSGDGANLMYAGVLAVGIGGAVGAGLEPRGMARAMFATAAAQALVAVIAVLAGLGAPASGPVELLAINGFFVALFGGSALLFRRAARELPRARAGAAG